MTDAKMYSDVNYRVTVVTVGCNQCGAPRGAPCVGRSGKAFKRDMHTTRRSQAAAWRFQNREKWRELRRQAFRPAYPAWGLQ